MKKVSVIIVNYNGMKWLPRCLSTISNQDYDNYEIIVVDNCSNDKSIDFIKKNFQNVILIENNENSGFAKGNNLGYEKSSGDYILLLNNDTHVPYDFITNFINVFTEIPYCSIAQSKIVLMENPNKIDSSGSFWTDYTFLYHTGYHKNSNDKKYNECKRVFSAKGASMLIKREVIEDIGLFDDSFWCYYEETDFCHRALNSGYETFYYPKAFCYHHMGGTSKNFKNNYVLYHSTKNRIRSFIKNFSNFTLFKVLYINLSLLLFYSIYLTLSLKINYTIALYKAVLWNIINIRDTLNLRSKFVLSKNGVNLKCVTNNPKLSYFYYLVTDLTKYND